MNTHYSAGYRSASYDLSAASYSQKNVDGSAEGQLERSMCVVIMTSVELGLELSGADKQVLAL